MAKEKLQRILDSIWVADLWGWSPWQCLVGLPHSQKPTSCVGVRQTDWNSPQSAALPSLTRRGWTSSDYFMRWKEKAALTSIRLLCTLFLLLTGWCLDLWYEGEWDTCRGKEKDRLFFKDLQGTHFISEKMSQYSILPDWQNKTAITLTHREDVATRK